MLLQKPGKRSLQLAGAIAVDESHRAVIGQQGLVEKSLGLRKRFVDSASDDVQIRHRGVARLKGDVHSHVSLGRQLRPADDAQIANAGAHPLAAHIEFRGAVVYCRDDSFDAKSTEHDPVAY